MKRPSRPLFFTLSVVASLLAAMALTTACSGLAYYSQSVSGHLSLMHQRQPVNKLLAVPGTDPQLAAALRLSQDIVDFAESELLLEAGGSYREVVITGQPAVTWNVVAAGEFSVDAKTWCFPVAGCVPYRGYFKQREAEQFASQLGSKGLDVFVSPATAYSTLGWFDDPLLDTMFRYSNSQLAAVLIHELAHQKLYLAGDTAFNESFAEFVESVGMQRWLQLNGTQAERDEWSRWQAAEPQFASLLASSREALRSLYASGQDAGSMRREKQRLLQQLQLDYASLVSEQWQGKDYFGGWLGQAHEGGSDEGNELNNARLALAGSYAGGTCAFAGLYRQAGENLAVFYALAEQQSRLPDAARQAWLQAPCSGFASTGVL
jgi:predicted aminopeptidase